MPKITIGRIGVQVVRASSKAPGLNGRNSPSIDRVPSGNIMIELPSPIVVSHACIICTTLSTSAIRWLPGTTRVAPLAPVKSSTANMAETIRGRWGRGIG
ncbi:MAG: hypothetical protein OEU32_19540, partial [Acidimicrobiia bacterium]|nr:hypothetical protein [Acidimicrobiia bacterium]